LARVRVVDFAPVDDDELVLPKLEKVADAGRSLWWLSYRRCAPCGRHWLVAQEERINDVFVIREMSDDEARDIQQCGIWPDDFNRYETLLRLGQEAGHSARFMDSRCATLQRTAKNLIDDRPEITDEEIADLLNVSLDDAAWLRHAVSEGRDSGLGT
jgi:hypothetical protein